MGLLRFATTFFAAACIFIVSWHSHAASIQYTQKTDTPEIIIFIHGLFGNSTTSFKSQNAAASWPDLLKTDNDAIDDSIPKMSDYSIASVEYSNTNLTPAEAASQLETDLRDAGIFKKYKKIVFIAHSLGGIVLKTMYNTMTRSFDNSKHEEADRILAMIFFGTPSEGAPIANLSRVYTNTYLDIRTVDSNSFLQDLQQNWLEIMSHRKAGLPKVYCAYEKKATYIGWVVGSIVIVPQAYVDHQCDDGSYPVEKDHIQLVKPVDKEDRVYTWTRSRINEAFDAARKTESIGVRVIDDNQKRTHPKTFFRLVATIRHSEERLVDLPSDKQYGQHCSDEAGAIGIMCLKSKDYATFNWKFSPTPGYHWDTNRIYFEEIVGAPFGGMALDKATTASAIIVGAWVRSDPPNKAKGRLRAYEISDNVTDANVEVSSGEIKWGYDIPLLLPVEFTSWFLEITVEDKGFKKVINASNLNALQPDISVALNGRELLIQPVGFREKEEN